MVGTAMFCSLNTHQGLEQSRRDDIEAIVYIVTYMVKKLPWESVASKQIARGQGVKEELESPTKKVKQKGRQEIYDKIYEVKKVTNFESFFCDPTLLP